MLWRPRANNLFGIGTEFRAKCDRASSLVATSALTGLNRYACTDVLAQADGARESVQLSAISTASLQSDDVVCQFVDLDTSIVLRQHGDYYSFVGKAYLDDSFHTRFWQGSGSVGDMQRLSVQYYPQIWQGSSWKYYLETVTTGPLTQHSAVSIGFCKTRDGSSDAARAVLVDGLEDDYRRERKKHFISVGNKTNRQTRILLTNLSSPRRPLLSNGNGRTLDTHHLPSIGENSDLYLVIS